MCVWDVFFPLVRKKTCYGSDCNLFTTQERTLKGAKIGKNSLIFIVFLCLTVIIWVDG